MKTPFAEALLVAAAVLGPAAVRAQPQYRVTLLHPPEFVSSSAAAISGGMIGGSGDLTENFSPSRALLWNETLGTVANLHPAGFEQSSISSVWGMTQGGNGVLPEGAEPGGPLGLSRALLWHGTAESVVNLHPAGFDFSVVTDVADQQQVGVGSRPSPTVPVNFRALLWQGTADSVVELHPAGFSNSFGTATSEATQVGWGRVQGTATENHALLWRGTAESVVDLHPTGWDQSYAADVWGTTQVGNTAGFVGDQYIEHAYLWTGTAASAVDLHPAAGYLASFAEAVAGNIQVGYGQTISVENHALMWRGSATSVVDLHAFVKSQLGVQYVHSYAFGVDASGDIVGYVADENFQSYAVKWSPIPEPASWSLLAGGLAAGGRRGLRRRCL